MLNKIESNFNHLLYDQNGLFISFRRPGIYHSRLVHGSRYHFKSMYISKRRGNFIVRMCSDDRMRHIKTTFPSIGVVRGHNLPIYDPSNRE